MLTPWGYSVDELPPIVTAEEFETLTGGKHAGDIRIEPMLDAVSAVVRSYCNWHVSPELRCTANLTASGRIAKLPALVVTGIESVTDGGEELDEGKYEWLPNGLVRRCCFKQWSQAWSGVSVAYTAGVEDAGLKQLVANLASGVLSAPTGVSSESAGNVSVSWDADLSRVDSALNDRTKGMLRPYRLTEGA